MRAVYDTESISQQYTQDDHISCTWIVSIINLRLASVDHIYTHMYLDCEHHQSVSLNLRLTEVDHVWLSGLYQIRHAGIYFVMKLSSLTLQHCQLHSE